MNMLDYILAATVTADITKARFGEIMHSDEYTEEQKREVLDEVERLGGYDNLPE